MAVYFWLFEFTPISILTYQTNKLYKKNLKMITDSRDADLKHLEKKKDDELYKESLEVMEKEIKGLQENRNEVLKIIGKYQDANKKYRNVLKIWREFLTNLEEYNNARLDSYVGMDEIMSNDRQIELRNKLLTGEKIIKEISTSIFT
ncbi:MAG: hypothetical protein UU02_C0013G0008 [Candidatus Woesebacteria bacterium GW2011_GWA1_40_43]|uniref:Uncharacterized protein n=1 Tax=Candidatus Woesebacteria bacterium GW2011_GWA1_40_43 TaxID=1618553 RepID=A0A0G0UWJ4_9BACT|nr:MAG: hypothetical protein UT88_C0024G0009 [Candidatus Woesebacteria bacterium GW2011_GWD2_40_19]KKR57619.1 MAG: hypothetical protein UT96_C0016G0004 [Candidatus Woesebacteria bacterium GW2011_GWC2_40_30]KKR64050.1 MAG: hypothetical protein UU02_C0013G0008 [Candidatus Woesebacteria bacterium GW2011_GWA1_40_43]